MKEFQAAIVALSVDDIAGLQTTGEIEIHGESFSLDEIQVQQQARAGTSTVSNRFISVDLDCALDDELIRGGYAREIVNRIQQRRKELALNVADRIKVRYDGDQELARSAREHAPYISESTLAVSFEHQPGLKGVQADIGEHRFSFEVAKA